MTDHDKTALVTAAEWFAGGNRIWYSPEQARVLLDADVPDTPDALQVFERVHSPSSLQDQDTVWLTMLPGFPDGSYGWAQVDQALPANLAPRLYVEPVGQGDSDKPKGYRYSTMERADLIEALWRHHGVRRTVVVTFDYTSLALLELLQRQVERPTSSGGSTTTITAIFMMNGGLFHDSHSHPWQGTPLLRSPVGALGVRGWQRSAAVFSRAWRQARIYSSAYHPTELELHELWSAITRREGAKFAHEAAGFVKEHGRHRERWDLAAVADKLAGSVAIYIGGSSEDAYEQRQVPAARQRVPAAEILAFPGGHLTTSEHPELLATAIKRYRRKPRRVDRSTGGTACKGR